MRFAIVTNLANGVGLQRDYELLRGQLEALGHSVQGVQFDAPGRIQPADVAVFLEVINEALLDAAPRLWAVPNPEWWFGGWDRYLPRFERVLAKTRDCERIFRHKCDGTTSFLGWTARDLYDASVPRERRFLHPAGKSSFKNTAAVVEACRRAGMSDALTVIGQHVPPGVPCRLRVSEDELKRELNRHQFHVLPSAYEGYGHALHEALGVGAIVITTDAPPMNEIGTPFMVPSRGSRPHHQAPLHQVDAADVEAQVRRVLALDEEAIARVGRVMRQRFIAGQIEFEQNLGAVLAKG